MSQGWILRQTDQELRVLQILTEEFAASRRGIDRHGGAIGANNSRKG
jgi:hypothetical protein